MAPEDIPAADPGAEHPDQAPPEHRVVGSPHAVAANAAVLALTRAARSFTLYDPSNKVVRTLIADYRDKLRHVLDAFGALELDVHPFELLLGGEVVYVERDRERSLAFRLFRDGVRQLSFASGTTWDELLRLLQILSIRYTGVRQQEDDLVTLLRKAGFDNVRVAAIEGFLPEEELAEPPVGDLLRGVTEHYAPPARWDLPLPSFPEAAPLRFRPVDSALLGRLVAEEDEKAVPSLAVRAVTELLATSGDDDLGSVLGFALEAREFLLVEQRGDLLRALAGTVRAALDRHPEKAAAFLESFLDPRTLKVLVGSLGEGDVPEDLAALLDAVPGDMTGRLLELLVQEGDGPRAEAVRRLVVRGFRRSPEALTERLRQATGDLATVLLRLLSEVDPGAGLRAAIEIAPDSDVSLQQEALRLLEEAPFGPEVARALHHLLGSPHAAVRLRALPAMAARGGPRVFSALQHHVEKHAAGLEPAEAQAAGRALARSSARPALDLFAAWVQAKGGLLGRLGGVSAPLPLQQVALGGLESIGGAEAEGLLTLLAEKGQEDVARRARAALAARRRAAGGQGG
jgi:hypothetical protein